MQEEKRYLSQVEEAIDENVKLLTEERDGQQDFFDKTKSEFTSSFYEDDAVMMSRYKTTLAETENQIELLSKRIESLKKQKPRPYFARVDFHDNQLGTDQKIYIGLSHISDSNKQYVCDWRAPISSLYYDYDEGEAEYESPDGEVKGKITLKRQFGISDGKLNYYVDTKQNINDEILQQVLSKNSSTKMQEIVSTIQKEQNAIIREEKFRTILVQGVAGSGKTSIALHRAGYLLFKHKNDFNSNDVLILSPSNLFSSYVSEVLPELGEDNVIEMTFSHIAKTELKKKIQPREKLIDEIYANKNQTKLNEIAYKASFEFLNDLLEFLNKSYASLFDPKDLVFKPKDADVNSYNAFTFTRDEMMHLYFEVFGSLPVNKRIDYMTDYLIERFGLRAEESELIKPRFKSMLYKFFPIDDIYKICNVFYARMGLSQPAFDTVPYEDAAALLVIKEYTQGLSHEYGIKYVIIDEMQDFSPMHFYFFNRIWDCPKIILGDINQCIEKTLSKKYLIELARFLKAKTIVLNKTYRATRQISQFSENLIGLKGVVNFNREGKEPRIIRTNSTEEALLKLIKEAEGKFTHTAIVCKTSEEVARVSNMLKDKVKFEVIVGSDESFDYPLVVTTASTSKGIEFDYVIIPFADEANYHSPLDRNMLYVASTRALHELDILYEGKKSKFLKRHEYTKNDQ